MEGDLTVPVTFLAIPERKEYQAEITIAYESHPLSTANTAMAEGGNTSPPPVHPGQILFLR